MNGLKPIVLMLRNHGFYEHDTIVSAKAEAERLARMHEGTTVVYVPVAITHPPKGLCTERVVIDPAQLQMAGLARADDDLPF